jgi:RNA polymerase sigma-70 factor (ECF subfamily)
MQSTPDEVLIGRIANGDRLAMQVLYAYHVRVFRFVVRLVRDEATAEDVISEVFLDVWRQAGRFEGRSAVSTWMLAIARFKALSALRRRPDQELDEETAGAIEDPSDDPGAALEKKDKSAMIRKCLTGAFGGTSGGHRSRVLPREIGRRGSRDRWHSGEHSQDAHVLRA